ncbi:sulfotransferase domain-containing protein [Mechercharimyces sp. CAU 1602]|uniref:sulfotransferase domain-containing protein n=1 Tax=Mechercharimyces sp. CAU 1602 TaxID=2973933 RepID=UPI002163258E|nr:sulfotransferase domain-containing protein [Mechercharimyces sp. CAU 1602]MCS1350154.1 sulfotransferase domain-containing protein [Mechercharimyces sp. CAU 1602]
MRNIQLPKVLILSLPKSGTNLLMQVIQGIPTLTYRNGNDSLTLNQLYSMKPGDIWSGHNDYTKAFHRKLIECNVKVIYISRDPRDVAVSYTHFLEKIHTTPPLAKYLRLLPTHQERLLTVIRGVRPAPEMVKESGLTLRRNIIEVSKPSYLWIEQPGICAVTFEEMMESKERQYKTVERIAVHLFPELRDNHLLRKNLVRQMINNINPKKSWSFRSGRIGDWKSEFKPVHKSAFKQIGGGNLLMKLGYEKDLYW